MSEDHGDELNFNELVGNLLSSHNATESHGGEDVDPETHFDGQEGVDVDEDGVPEHLEAELPEFGDGEEDDALAAVVASAIQSMDHEDRDENEEEDALPSSGIEQENDDHQQDRHWANVLQQSLLQGNEPAKGQAEEQLDQDDETLRRAILESLSELNTAERQSKPVVDDKEKPKKSSKKKKKKEKEHAKEKHTSAKKKKHHKKGKDTSNDADDLLDFDDVIKGFMRQGNEASEEVAPQPEVAGDEETQALVEATLRAFERELLGSQSGTQAPKTHVKSKEPAVKDISAQQNVVSRGDDLQTGITPSLVDEESSKKEVPSTASKKKKKKKKKRKQPKDLEKDRKESDEDEFSKALAAMVNEVVNTSLTDSAPVAPESPQTRASPVVEAPTVDQEVEDEHEQVEEETFDLNQIMQKAMSMAFQEQTQESFDSSAMEEFNRGLGDLSVSDIISGGSAALKKKSTSKASRTQMTPRVPKTARKKASSVTGIEEEPSKRKSSAKPPPSPEEILRKRYCQAAMAAAATARKRAVARNKTMRLHLRAERKKAREEKKLQKKQAKEQLEIERKELEEIVAKGPPYPPDLRLTKSGKPKKPYRRWTQWELEKRASMPPEDLEKPKKVKKTKKKKTKKLKKVPLSNLKKIPLFNFGRDSVPVEVKHKLNGIDETLEKIPLQSYQPDISKLAPPDTVSPESWQKQQKTHEGDELFEKARYTPPFAFDAGRKTVVRREKIPFHPPWALPSQVPYALPLARRKRKEKPKESPSTAGGRQRVSKSRRSSISSSVRNRIIPAVLLPIIGTLKAAAKAKVASGASPEEANRHLVTIIRHTKRSIAESLSLARRHSTRNYSSIKSEHDLHSPSEMKSRKAARIPIFSLSRIKQIDTSEDNVVKPTEPSKSEPHVSIVKIEDEESTPILNPAIETVAGTSQNKAHERDSQEPISVRETPTANETPGDPDGVLNEGPEKALDQEVTRSDQNMDQPILNNEGERTLDVPEEEITEAEREKTGEGLQTSLVVRTTEQDSTGEAESAVLQANGSLLSTEKPSASQIAKETSPPSPNLGQKRSRNDEQLAALRTVISEGANVTKGSLESLKDTIDKSSVKEEQKIHDVLDDLVKEHFAQSSSNPVELPDNVRNIISETIEELIPVIDVQQRDREEKPKRQRKGPPPVLNLDGLVPPNNLSVIPKIESSPSPSVSQKLAPKVRKPRKKPDQPVLLYTFNVPDLKNTQGKRTMLLKRAKEYLSPEEMTVLKKEINKERKRKWREANVEKNWENDLRARLKKRANAKFGDQDTLEKSKWYQDELNKGLSEREVKQEEPNNADGNASNKKTNGSTNLSDNEVLNMIATALNKLDVARLLERELNEDAAGYQDEAQNKKSKASAPMEEVCEEHAELQKITQPVLQTSVPSYDEQVSYDGQEPHNDNGEVLDESGNTKRPYPDDIPVTVSLVKRPKSVSAQEDK